MSSVVFLQLHVGPQDTGYTYTMQTDNGPQAIEKVTNEKDLGVIIDSKLTFRDHISAKVNLANRNLGIIFRTFIYLDTEMFINVFIQVTCAPAFGVCYSDLVPIV